MTNHINDYISRRNGNQTSIFGSQNFFICTYIIALKNFKSELRPTLPSSCTFFYHNKIHCYKRIQNLGTYKYLPSNSQWTISALHTFQKFPPQINVTSSQISEIQNCVFVKLEFSEFSSEKTLQILTCMMFEQTQRKIVLQQNKQYSAQNQPKFQQ